MFTFRFTILSTIALALLPLDPVLAVSGAGWGSKTDPVMARDLMLISERNGSTESGWLADRYIPKAIQTSMPVYLCSKQALDEKEIAELGERGWKVIPSSYLPPVGNHPYGLTLASAPPEVVQAELMKGNFPRIVSAYRSLQPLNDSAAIRCGAVRVRQLNPPLRGSGVRLAIVDSGFQLDHPDLPNPAIAMDYADYPDTSEDVTNHVTGHGTHVAGTAFGTGAASGGKYAGIAPDASPIYLKIGDDTTSDASTASVVAAFKAAGGWCRADIASMSYGGYDGFCDGSSPEEQAVDWAVGQGTVVTVAAGNSAGYGYIYSGMVEANSTTNSAVIVATGLDAPAAWGFFLIYDDGADTSVHRDLQAIVMDTEGGYPEMHSPGRVSSPRGTESISYVGASPLPIGESFRHVFVRNNSNTQQRFLLLVDSPSRRVHFFGTDGSYTVMLPSTADSALSIGAYVSRTEWLDYGGVLRSDNSTPDAIAFFSSHGPRIDGLQKPDITAPGMRIISCRDSANVPINGDLDYLIVSDSDEGGLPAHYAAFIGTSMAAPAAAGTSALLIEARPDLRPYEVRDLVKRGSRRDQLTGDVPNLTWGWGKIDVSQILSASERYPKSRAAPSVFGLVELFPNPSNHQTVISLELLRRERIELRTLDVQGRLLSETAFGWLEAGVHKLELPRTPSDPSNVSFVVVKSNAESKVLRSVDLK